MKHVELIHCSTDTKVGNHRVEINQDGTKDLIYYRTIICSVNPHTKEFTTLKHRISTSTSCAIGKYRNYLTARGYREVQ